MGPKTTPTLHSGGTRGDVQPGDPSVTGQPLAAADTPLDRDARPGDQSQPVPAPPVLRRSRIGAARTALIVSAVVLVLLLVFIVENGRSVKVSFLGASGHMPLGVAMLFAAIAGALLLAIPGTARIVQLRRAARRQHRQDVPR
jgi:uncharacterized integral membrane protein